MKKKKEYKFTWDLDGCHSLKLPKGHKFYSFYLAKKSNRCYVLTDKGVIELLEDK